MEKKLLVIDIETTGFLNQGGSIVEIGIAELDMETGEANIIFDSVCKESILTAKHREEPFGWIFRNSNLSVEEVRYAPPFEEVAEEVQSIIDDYPLGATAYNRQFDIEFLQSRNIRFHKLQPCPMQVATNICKLPATNGRSKYKWPKVEEAWAQLFPGQPYTEVHRGADDALHEAMILYKLYEMGEYELM